MIIERKDEILERLKCDEILFVRDQVCTRITKFSAESVDGVNSNQKEADTKLLLHARDVLESSIEAVVLVRSPSGDIDIICKRDTRSYITNYCLSTRTI